jgi:GNAT superfamily N-acetyltransferase
MDDYTISTDKSKLNLHLIHKFLTTSYWAEGRSFEDVKKSIENSICYGIYDGNKQVGFARIITDYVVFAYLMDVFIIEEYRGKGLSKMLLNKILNDESLRHVKKWLLATKDAHTLYEQFGFRTITSTGKYMEKT